MTRFRISRLTGLLAGTLLALACGNVKSTGQVNPGEDGGVATSGNGGANGDGGTSSPGGASGASGSSGESGTAGAAGTAGGAASGGTSGGGGFGATDAGPICRVPQPPPIPNPTPEQVQRATLIHDYCTMLARDNCLSLATGSSFIYEQARGCSTEGRIAACEQDRLYEYVGMIAPPCDDEWQAAIRCVTGQTLNACQGASLFGTPTVICDAEKNALQECMSNNNTWKPVHGAKARCDYSESGTLGGCEVACTLGSYNFLSLCGGPAGTPLQCTCLVNGQELGIFDWQPTVFYASNCAEAAQRFADGEWCTNRMDCCIKWTAGGKELCECGSETGCAQAAEARGADGSGQSTPATRVEKCPQYDYVH
jgi:hypothetical protein